MTHFLSLTLGSAQGAQKLKCLTVRTFPVIVHFSHHLLGSCWPICLFFQTVIFFKKEASLWPHGKPQGWTHRNTVSKTGFLLLDSPGSPSMCAHWAPSTLRRRISSRLQVAAPGNSLHTPCHRSAGADSAQAAQCSSCRLSGPVPPGGCAAGTTVYICQRHGVRWWGSLGLSDEGQAAADDLLSWTVWNQAALTLGWMRFPTGDVVLKRPRTRFRDPHADIPAKGSDEDWRDQLSGFAQGDSSQLLTAGTPHNYPSSQALVSYLTDWPTHTAPSWGCSVLQSPMKHSWASPLAQTEQRPARDPREPPPIPHPDPKETCWAFQLHWCNGSSALLGHTHLGKTEKRVGCSLLKMHTHTHTPTYIYTYIYVCIYIYRHRIIPTIFACLHIL